GHWLSPQWSFSFVVKRGRRRFGARLPLQALARARRVLISAFADSSTPITANCAHMGAGSLQRRRLHTTLDLAMRGGLSRPPCGGPIPRSEASGASAVPANFPGPRARLHASRQLVAADQARLAGECRRAERPRSRWAGFGLDCLIAGPKRTGDQQGGRRKV